MAIEKKGSDSKKKDFGKKDFGKRDFGFKRETHEAICDDCKKKCEVPFKPDGTRPVYCKECYQKHRKKRRF